MAEFYIKFLYNSAIFIVILCIVLFWALRKRYAYWRNKGVHSPKPDIPFGNTKDVVLQRETIAMTFSKLYFENKKHPYMGIFMVHRPTLMINDLDMIKDVITKDFAHFSDRGYYFDEDVEPLCGQLFSTCGEKWKNLRQKLTPTFTSNKMKKMFDILAECAEEMAEYLENNALDRDCDDMKEIFAKFGNDVIANCAFGIECKSFKNPEEKFRRMGRRLFNLTFRERLSGAISFFIPEVTNFFKLKVLGYDVQNFFYGIVEETVKYREQNGIVRNDFMQLLIDLNQGIDSDNRDKSEAVVDDGTRLTMMQLAAQVFVFFIAGFETSSTTASFALYELALNPEIQATLAEEIDKTLDKYSGRVTYDSLGEMTYLTKVIEETMRKYPPLPVLFRICTKEYRIPETDVIIEKDTPVMIPIYGIQRDPEFYPNPNKFDPERFTPENKAARHHFSYLPFGEGPRICIGSRFGMMQTKLGLATFLSKYEVSVCSKTLIPMAYDKRSFVLTSNGGVWLRLTKRVRPT